MSIEMSRLGASEVEAGRSMGSAETEQGRAMGDLVAILDGCHNCGMADAPAQYPGAGANRTGGSTYSPHLPLNPSNLDEFMGLGDVGVLMDLMEADAQFPGAGGVRTGGSNYSPLLPLSPSNLASMFGDASPRFPGAGGVRTGGSDYSPFLPLNPNGLADVAARFPGAGGVRTGGSDYSPQLPLSPSGLAFGVVDAVCDFAPFGKLEHPLCCGGNVENQLEGTSGPMPATQSAVAAASVVPTVTPASSAAAASAIARSVAVARSAARNPAQRAAFAGRVGKQTGQLRALAAQRRSVADKARSEYASKFATVVAQDKEMRAARAKGAPAGQLQKLDGERRENGRQAVRWAKLNAVARLMARNADTQATVAKQVVQSVSQGNPEAAGKFATHFAVLGQSTKQLRLIRARQVQLWTSATQQTRDAARRARRARSGVDEYARVGTWLSSELLGELGSTTTTRTTTTTTRPSGMSGDDIAATVAAIAAAVSHIADAVAPRPPATPLVTPAGPPTMPDPAGPPAEQPSDKSWAVPVGIGAAGLVAMAIMLL
jgi:hypothetical protein